jgi:glyoxylase I family protein
MPDLAAHLEALERELLTPDARKSARVDELLADDFVEFGSSGRVYTKAAIVAALRGEIPTTLTAADFQLRMLGPDVALLTYRTRRHGEPDFHALRSSIWRRDGGSWRMAFHQGTPTTPRDGE